MDELITAGELAKLASTTKRTILFYDEKGVLKPVKINSSGYRFYSERQILDYQMILLLSTLGITLSEMKQYLKNKGVIQDLFNDKKRLISKEINRLTFNLATVDKFLKNIKSNGTMVKPEIKKMTPFGVYYVEKTGSYSKIESYCIELAKMFVKKGRNYVSLAIFEEEGYRPKKSRIMIGVIAQKDTTIDKRYKDIVRYMKFKPGKVITCTHNGSGSTLSLFWKELEKYCRLHKIKIRKNTPDFEIYRRVNSDISKQFFEIYLPIV